MVLKYKHMYLPSAVCNKSSTRWYNSPLTKLRTYLLCCCVHMAASAYSWLACSSRTVLALKICLKLGLKHWIEYLCLQQSMIPGRLQPHHTAKNQQTRTGPVGAGWVLTETFHWNTFIEFCELNLLKSFIKCNFTSGNNELLKFWHFFLVGCNWNKHK